jgi:hypothetical protein
VEKMSLHRRLADPEILGDDLVAHPARHQGEDLDFSRVLSERSTGPRLRLTSLLATDGESTESPRAVTRMARNSSSLGVSLSR